MSIFTCGLLYILLLSISTVFATSKIHFKEEVHLKNVRQLTFGGQNAEGYFSFDGNWLTFQATGIEVYGTNCDQIYKIDLKESPHKQIPHRISTGLGVCTCSYFYPNDREMIYAGTFHAAILYSNETLESCPVKKCQSKSAYTDPVLKKLCHTSYTWDLFRDYDIYKVNEFGTVLKRLTNIPGYDAEGAISPDGKHIVFTSVRSGDPEIWIMNSDGTNPKQLTYELGYDGGPFFSPDGTIIAFRASRPKTAEDIAKYKALLSYDLVSPLEMELYTMNIDGSDLRKVTTLGGSNWAPFYMPNNRRIIFSTNFNNTGHFGAFDLYAIDEDGTNLERITYNNGGFDAFPMFDRQGKRLVWGSSRNGKSRNDLNLFIAEWIDSVSERSKGLADNLTLKKEVIRSRKRRGKKKLRKMSSHLRNVRSLTMNDTNCRASYSIDGRNIAFQGKGNKLYATNCTQIFALDTHKSKRTHRRLSTGFGITESARFLPDGDIIYSSTWLSVNRSIVDDCLKSPCEDPMDLIVKDACARSFVRMLPPESELFKVNYFGNFLQRLTVSEGYDGDVSVSSDGSHIVFTSTRTGDPELWIMRTNDSDLRQLTNTIGYEGSASFSFDGKFIVYQATRPRSHVAIKKYRELLSKNMVNLEKSQIFVMQVTGDRQRQVTNFATNWSPSFMSDRKIVFSSNRENNMHNHNFTGFNLFVSNVDGTRVEQVTFGMKKSNIWPVKHENKLLWNSGKVGTMNVYEADWDGFTNEN